MSLKIALVQCDAQLGDVDANLELHHERVAEARAQGADLVVFPELSLTGYLLQDIVPEVALSPEDPRLRELSVAAGDAAVCVGGIEESREHAQYIAAFYLEGGEVKAVHRKAYLASYGVFDEARYVGRGDRLAAIDARIGRVGLTICEDSWHPTAVGVLILDGAELLVVQTASPVRDLREGRLPENARTWLGSLQSTARLYGCYVAFCNRVGTEDGLVFWGNSMLIGPDGDTVAEGPLYDEALVIGDFDRERVRRARLTNPILREERMDLTIRELERIRSGGRTT